MCCLLRGIRKSCFDLESIIVFSDFSETACYWSELYTLDLIFIPHIRRFGENILNVSVKIFTYRYLSVTCIYEIRYTNIISSIFRWIQYYIRYNLGLVLYEVILNSSPTCNAVSCARSCCISEFCILYCIL